MSISCICQMDSHSFHVNTLKISTPTNQHISASSLTDLPQNMFNQTLTSVWQGGLFHGTINFPTFASHSETKKQN